MRDLTFCILLLLFLVGCSNGNNQAGWIDNERLKNPHEADWLALGGNYLMQHYSSLNQINASNAKDLGFAWAYDVPREKGNVHRGFEATPIIVDGVLYTSGPWGFAYAVDARNGKEIWRYIPDVDGAYGRRACCDVVNRGLAVWKGKVYVGTLDGFLVCLDAKTGDVIWRKDTFTDRTKAYTITGPPQVAGNIVMIGNSGGEYGVRGYITAYDLKDGRERWRFFIVPGKPENGYEHAEMEMAAKTWDPNSLWDVGGGGTSWGESAYDPDLNLLYVGTGNPTPYPIWLRSPSGGDNLFLASILAINPDNGKLVWHYQTTPGEIWDYTATMNIVLADIEIDKKRRKVLMQAPKNGFFYMLDRVTGELISAEKFTRVTWASHVDLKTGRPAVTEQGRYKEGPKLVAPFLGGGHNWQPMSFNPVTGLVYIPERTVPVVYEELKNFSFKADEDNTALDYGQLFNYRKVIDQVREKEDTLHTESLLAWNPVTQKQVWKVAEGAPDGGVLSTPDLVFQGTRTGYLKIYNAVTGEKINEIFTGTGIMAAPATYSIDGVQYVTVMAGYGGAPTAFYPSDAAMFTYQNIGRIITFRLEGHATPLPPKRILITTPRPPEMPVKESLVNSGAPLYWTYCSPCHGGFGKDHRSNHPDLSKLSEAKHKVFNEIVIGGLISQYGMASFSNSLTEQQVESIHHFLVLEQDKNFRREQKSASKK